MIKKWKITIPELTGSEKRNAYVYVPNIARNNSDLRFPVLYMFDGHNVFFDRDATYGKSWGMFDFMETTNTPLIIAAVECNHSPNHGRLSEYSPYNFYDRKLGRIRGRGYIYMDWLVNSFKPLVDQLFPTIPDREHTFIGGSSMGGLMSLCGVTSYNHVFSRAAALSPSIWFAPGQLDQMLCQSVIGSNTVVYMDYGSEELSNHRLVKKQFVRVSSRLLDRGILLNSRIVPGGTHCEASWEKQIPIFMNTLLYDL